jgi:hypothetical protein
LKNKALSLFWRSLTNPDTAARELAEISAVSHGAICFGSLAPFSIVDGGILLKWSLVSQGHSEAEADAGLKKAGARLIAALLLFIAAGSTLLLKRKNRRRS